MGNKELDDLLNSALVPSVTASSQLNQSIFKACENNNGKAVKRNGKKIKTMRLLPRVAVFALICKHMHSKLNYTLLHFNCQALNRRLPEFTYYFCQFIQGLYPACGPPQ